MHVACGVYEGLTEPMWMRTTGVQTPWLDVSACGNEDGWVSVCVVNVHLEEDMEVAFEGVEKGREIEVYTVTGGNVMVTNVEGKEEVRVTESRWDGEGNFTFGKHSLTMLRWRC